MNLDRTEKRIENQDDFKEIAENIMDCAVKELKGEGTVIPKVFFFTDEGNRYVTPIPWAHPQWSFQIEADAALLAKKLQAKRLIFLSDAIVGDGNGPPPSEDPKRKGAILLIAEDGNHTFGILQEYWRKRKGKRIKIGKRQEIEKTEGCLTGILQD